MTPGPLWTRARVEHVMRLRFGTSAAGRVSTRIVAEEMGCSRRTVQRWLHTADGRAPAPIPAKRLAQLIDLLQPGAHTLAQEADSARFAAKTLAGLADRSIGATDTWIKQRYFEPHAVVVLEVQVGEDLSIRQLAVARDEPVKRRAIARRGLVVEEVLVPSRFHATVLTHRVLVELGPWRFRAGPGQVAQGFTQAWLTDAPPADLARDLPAPVPSS